MRLGLVLCSVIWLASFASPVIADEPQFLGRTREQWVEQLESLDRRQQRYSAWAISQMACDEVNASNAMLWLNELCLLTESQGSTVRYWGAIGLGRMTLKLEAGNTARSKAVEALAGLLEDRATGPRLAAAEALCLAGEGKRGLPVLVEAMSHPHDAVRVQAATALERIGEEARPAAETLRAAASDPSEYVKRLALRALAKLDAPTK